MEKLKRPGRRRRLTSYRLLRPAGAITALLCGTSINGIRARPDRNAVLVSEVHRDPAQPDLARNHDILSARPAHRSHDKHHIALRETDSAISKIARGSQ